MLAPLCYGVIKCEHWQHRIKDRAYVYTQTSVSQPYKHAHIFPRFPGNNLMEKKFLWGFELMTA